MWDKVQVDFCRDTDGLKWTMCVEDVPGHIPKWTMCVDDVPGHIPKNEWLWVCMFDGVI